MINTLLFFKTLAELGVGVQLTAEQAREISDHLFSIPNIGTVMDLNSEIAILKDQLRNQAEEIKALIEQANDYIVDNPGMGFSREVNDIPASKFKTDILRKIDSILIAGGRST